MPYTGCIPNESDQWQGYSLHEFESSSTKDPAGKSAGEIAGEIVSRFNLDESGRPTKIGWSLRESDRTHLSCFSGNTLYTLWKPGRGRKISPWLRRMHIGVATPAQTTGSIPAFAFLRGPSLARRGRSREGASETKEERGTRG